jgi:hypothetical protein
MRITKILSIIVVTAFVAVFTYANVRSISPTRRLKQIQLASFNMTGDLTPESRAALEKKVGAENGVTACSINSDGTTASVTFYPDIVSQETLASILSNDNKLSVGKKEFATTGGCPVHGVTASFDRFITSLDLRK